MRIDKTPLNEETKNKIVQMLNDAEDKTQDNQQGKWFFHNFSFIKT